MANHTAGENSGRKRISIPPVDESSHAWWDAQKDPSLSVRLLIRAEIERNGYVDTAYRPVAQVPRRGRPPGTGSESEDTDGAAEPVATPAAAVAAVPAARPVAVAQPAPVPQSADSGFGIDALMNG